MNRLSKSLSSLSLSSITSFSTKNVVVAESVNYIKFCGNRLRFCDKKEAFTSDGVKYENYQEWKKANDKGYSNFYKYSIIGFTVVGGVSLFINDTRKGRHPEETLANAMAGSCAGLIFGIVHPFIIPIGVPLMLTVYPAYKISQFTYNRRNQEEDAARMKRRNNDNEETRKVLNDYTEFVDAELKKPVEQRNIIRYYDWCMNTNRREYRYGYKDRY